MPARNSAGVGSAANVCEMLTVATFRAEVARGDMTAALALRIDRRASPGRGLHERTLRSCRKLHLCRTLYPRPTLRSCRTLCPRPTLEVGRTIYPRPTLDFRRTLHLCRTLYSRPTLDLRRTLHSCRML